MTAVDPGVACVYRSLVMHQRMQDVAYRFRYRVFSVLVDIDRIPDVARATRFFSHNRWNLFSFHDRDHLPGDAAGLRPWVEDVLSQHGVDGAGLRIRLLCFPRFLGLVFNPLSLWYCERADGSPVAVVAEVRNTFGERHCYLLRPDDDTGAWPMRDDHAKDFHVSPFIGMDARYAFRLSRPDERLAVVIREYREGDLMLVATQTGSRRPFATSTLVRESLRVPFQTLKVLAAIHWQALKIWLRGGRFHRKPEPPMKEVS
jgi:DUF1365 family protein